MVELNNRDRTINVKIVYYGPAVCGKTTNIQMLHQHAAANRRGELISVNSAQDRTIMFDLLPLKASGFRGYDLKLQLAAVPGQAMYAAIRKLAVRNVDSLVFVANSAVDRQQENVASFREMTGNLVTQHIDPATLPLVFQYNKRDLPEVLDMQSLDRTLNARQTIAVPGVALRGEGVLETFKAILTLTVQDLARRYRLMDMGKGQSVEDWVTAAIQGIFATQSFAPPPPEEEESAENAAAPVSVASPPVSPGPGPVSPPPTASSTTERRVLRVPMASDVSAVSHPDARANEALVESYAEAATALTTVTHELREQRDLAQRRLADVLQVLEVARMLKPGAPPDPVLAVALGCLAQEVDSARASFLVKDPVQGIRIAAQRGLSGDPFLSDASAIDLLPGLFDVPSAHVFDADQNPALLENFLSADPPFGSVVCVAFTARSGAGGLALLYLAPNAARPSTERLSHLTSLARILTPLLAAPSAPASSAGAAPPPDLLGTACRLATPSLLDSLLSLRQQQADLRRRPGAPPWLAEGFAQLAVALGDSVAFTRGLQAFDRGELERERVEVSELLSAFGTEGLSIASVADNVVVAAQPALVRLALRALIDATREQAAESTRVMGESAGIVEIHCAENGGRLVMRIGAAGLVTPLPLTEDPRLVFATKVIELHGGQLQNQVDPTQRRWVALEVPTV
jgi:signal recognition particle receptor subunit beta